MDTVYVRCVCQTRRRNGGTYWNALIRSRHEGGVVDCLRASVNSPEWDDGLDGLSRLKQQNPPADSLLVICQSLYYDNRSRMHTPAIPPAFVRAIPPAFVRAFPPASVPAFR